MPKANEIQIGPWPGGLNQLDARDQLRDNQVTELLNLDVDNTGTLIPRRGVRPVILNPITTTSYALMGTIRLPGDLDTRLAVGVWNGTSTTMIIIGDPATASTSQTLSTLTGRYDSVQQYQDHFWFVPAEVTGVGRKSHINTPSNLIDVAGMEYGDESFILKDRLFVIRKASSEILYSKATDFSVWTIPDGGVVKVNPGDNAPITKVVVVNNQIIIFKKNSTFVFSYTASPGGDGSIRQVSADQGAEDACVYNNEVYTVTRRSVFKFVNGYFTDIGLQLDLTNKGDFDSSNSTAYINVVDKTLLVSGYAAAAGYGMNLDTGAWSKYSTDSQIDFFRSKMYQIDYKGIKYAVAGHRRGQLLCMYADRNRNKTMDYLYLPSQKTFVPSYKVDTKVYTFGDYHTWKRCHSWNLELESEVGLVGLESGVKINSPRFTDGTKVNATSDTTGLVGGGTVKSFRFQNARWFYKFDGYQTGALEPNLAVGPRITSFRARISSRSDVNT